MTVSVSTENVHHDANNAFSVIVIKHLEESMLSAIVDLAEDKAWQAINEYAPLLAMQMSKPFFDEQPTNLCMSR